MGRRIEQKRKENKNSSRFGKNQKETFANKHREMQKAIQKTKTTPLNTLDLLKLLRNQPQFLGVFASDELKYLKIVDYPVYFIANLDSSQYNGSHWIAFRITRFKIELFDSLGLNPSTWNQYPTFIINFLKSQILTKSLVISPAIQTPNSHICGLYCIFFIQYRRLESFKSCCRRFSKLSLEQNSVILKQLLLNLD